MRSGIVVWIGIFFLFNCTSESEENGIKISGFISNGDKPIEGVNVDLDGLVQYEAITNSEGYFEVRNVSPGQHELNFLHSLENTSFSQTTEIIQVSQSLELNNLILPDPVEFFTPIINSNLTENEVGLAWTKYKGKDFREYKVYQRNTPGLDEITGELIYVSTDSNDTTFQTHLPHSSEMYYRTFVLSESTLLAGSNLANGTTSSFANDPKIELGEERTIYLTSGISVWLNFEANKNEIYSAASFDNNFGVKGYTAGRTRLSVWNESKDDSYFVKDYIGLPYPFKATANEIVYVEIDNYSNTTTSGTAGVLINKLDKVNAIEIATNNTITSILTNPGDTKLAYFDAIEGIEYSIQVKNTEPWGAYGDAVFTFISGYGNEVDEPYFYMQAIPYYTGHINLSITALKTEPIYFVLCANDGQNWYTSNQVEISISN